MYQGMLIIDKKSNLLYIMISTDMKNSVVQKNVLRIIQSYFRLFIW